MNITDQICSLELSVRLKELGVKQDSLFYRFGNDNLQYVFCKYYEQYSPNINLNIKDGVSAFTVAELGELLKNPTPNIILTYKINDIYKCATGNGDIKLIDFEDISEADVRAKMLIYLLENKLMELSHDTRGSV